MSYVTCQSFYGFPSVYCAFGTQFESLEILRNDSERKKAPMAAETVYFRSTRWFTAPLIYFHVPRHRCRFPRSAFWSAKMNRQRGLGCARRDREVSASRENLWRGRRRLHRNRKCHFDRSLLAYNTNQSGRSSGCLPQTNQTVFPTHRVNVISGKLRIQLLVTNVFINYFPL